MEIAPVRRATRPLIIRVGGDPIVGSRLVAKSTHDERRPSQISLAWVYLRICYPHAQLRRDMITRAERQSRDEHLGGLSVAK